MDKWKGKPLKRMSGWLKVGIEPEEDPEIAALDKKVEETLKMIAQLSSSAPDALGVLLVTTLGLKRTPSGEIDWTGSTPRSWTISLTS
jgi:hypothetical protein